jgi:hypothetical protein
VFSDRDFTKPYLERKGGTEVEKGGHHTQLCFAGRIPKGDAAMAVENAGTAYGWTQLAATRLAVRRPDGVPGCAWIWVEDVRRVCEGLC